jgi:hypothetical protein
MEGMHRIEDAWWYMKFEAHCEAVYKRDDGKGAK